MTNSILNILNKMTLDNKLSRYIIEFLLTHSFIIIYDVFHNDTRTIELIDYNKNKIIIKTIIHSKFNEKYTEYITIILQNYPHNKIYKYYGHN